MTRPDPPLVRLTFRPLASAVPLAARVRRLLKVALRACGLRCVQVEELPTEEETERTPRRAPG
jgi:hypothetical protein